MSTEPDIPLLATPPYRSLREFASTAMPQMTRDGLRLEATILEGGGGEFVAMLQWKDFTGAVKMRRSATGKLAATGVIEWRF